ncbi:MAG: proteasome accessory factor PafA2 family protein [Chloroflexi bacterium]|nr:proteasome accessory factor PafA2 family protein [Chloroflexota bacterium]
MDGALFGTETEYACAGNLSPAEAASRVKDGVFSERKYGLIEPAPREWGEVPGNGGFLFNGGRLYLDSGHLEYATPECRSLHDIVAAERGGDQILVAAVVDLKVENEIFFIKNNTDHFGHTYGYHENYCLRVSPRSRDMVQGLLPFLVTRQLFTGSGMFFPAALRGRSGSRSGLLTDSSDPPGKSRFGVFGGGNSAGASRPPVPFQISQRAHFVSVDVSHRVRFGGRPILNLRDEPLAGGRFRRLHIIIGDANRSEWATALKLGTTALVAQLLELGWDPEVELENAVAALKEIARNPYGGWTVRMTDGKTIPAIDIQRVYLLEATKRFLGRDADTDWTLRQWATILNALEMDALRLDGYVDWVTKFLQLSHYAEKAARGWDDPALIKLDLAYHHVDPRVSLYTLLCKQGKIPTLVDDERAERAMHQPPADTRAAGRGHVVRAMAEARADDSIRWEVLARRLGERAVWGDERFVVYEYVDDWRDIRDTGAWHIIPYLIDWGAIAVKDHVLELSDPFRDYAEESERFGKSLPSLLRR